MATTRLKSFKPQPAAKTNFWFNLGIEDEKTTVDAAVHLGFKTQVYQNIIEKTRLSQNEFQHITHIPLSTLKRRLSKGERFSTPESDIIYRLALLLKLATELFGNEQRAAAWLRKGVYGLGGKRPLDMVSTSVDFDVVKELMGQIEHGVFS